MLTSEQTQVFYERSDASLLARAPATIPTREWASNQDWEDMRTYLEQVMLGLRTWRTPWWMHWGEIAANMLPRRYFWLITPNNMTRGLPINQDVVNSTPTQAIGVCAAGMMDGLSSPTKKWVKFEAPAGFEPDTAAKRWFAEFERRFYDVLAGSNYYDCKYQMYEDEIVFGTGPMLIYEDSKNVIGCQNPCAGEYYLGRNGSNSSNIVFDREFTQTTRQLMDRFGPEAIAGTDAGDLWNTKGANLETESVVGHSIEPNYPANQYGQKPNLGVVPGGYAYREYYWLRGKATPQPLSVRGFHERPYMCPLWNTRGNDPYGRGAGEAALPDVMQLHRMVRRLNEAIEKLVRPPMIADVAMKNEPSSSLPGRVTYVPNLSKDSGMRPMYTIDPKIDAMEKVIDNLEKKVERWFYNDVWLAVSDMEGVQPRNELELNERRSEKLLRLGPVIERNLREDAQGINRIVNIMVRRSMVPPKPPSLRGIPIQIKFVSKLAQLQKAAETAGIERTLAFAGRMEAAMPGTLDNFNSDKTIRDYGDKLDFPPDDWNDQSVMDTIRNNRNQAEQAKMAAQAATHVAPAMATAAQTLSQTDTGGGQSALQAILGGQK